ncbi:MAG: hypothetical protein Ta2E_02440 [Mycoplasmoidaceae bacterium]|nr:MAG: hypothetical protein Ta2E_02440 [Mycoplasmoidaceae bacterium]
MPEFSEKLTAEDIVTAIPINLNLNKVAKINKITYNYLYNPLSYTRSKDMGHFHYMPVNNLISIILKMYPNIANNKNGVYEWRFLCYHMNLHLKNLKKYKFYISPDLRNNPLISFIMLRQNLLKATFVCRFFLHNFFHL